MDGMRVIGGAPGRTVDGPARVSPADTIHPAFSALTAHTGIRACDDDGPFDLSCPRPHTVAVRSGSCSLPSDSSVFRFGLELAWLTGVPGLHPDACLILAARAAGGFIACLPARAPTPSPISALFAELAGDLPQPDRLAEAAFTLRQTRVLPQESLQPLEPATLHAMLAGPWAFAAACEALLVAGGDDRLRLDPATGLNRYGCAPWPRPDVIDFASSTASSISADALAAAEACRQRLIAAAISEPPGQVLERNATLTCDRILAYFGVEDLAGCVLAASGTDAALLLTALVGAEAPGRSMTSILMSPEETGSGVPDAVCACHFAACTASGDAVVKGAALDDAGTLPRLVTIPLRNDDGAPRTSSEVARECRDAIRHATSTGRAVLHAIDGSKTGLSMPDRDTCVALAREFAGTLDIAMDACQARLEPALVRFYIEQGFAVLVTGSKFFGAPGFCGAVLMPRDRLRRALRGHLPGGLGRYASLAGGTLQRRCPGLLLRWEAALHAMDGLRRVPPAIVAARIDGFGDAVRALIDADDRLTLVDAPRPAGVGWSDRRSVMTFTIQGSEGPLGMGALKILYKAMASDLAPRCQIGQPVAIGQAGLAGLRVSLGAAQIASGEPLEAPLAAVFAKLRLLLDRAALVPAA